MYSVNGVALDNATFGWTFRGPSKPISEISRARTSTQMPGLDGVPAGVPSTYDPVILPLVVQTPRADLETLCALVAADGYLTLTSNPNRRVAYEFLSWSEDGYGDGEAVIDVTFVIRLPGVFWRDTTETTTTAVNLSTSSVAVGSLFSNLSAPIQDAIVRVKGSCSGLVVTDTAGSWFSYAPALPSGSYVRFESATGRAWTVTSDVWTGGTEVSGDIDFGGPRNGFEITPAFTDPSARAGALTVATTARSGAQIQIRGRAAYLV